MRLVDADLIIETCNSYKGMNRIADLGIKLVNKIVSEAPTVDTDVVRCKDCKYWNKIDKAMYCTRHISIMHMTADDFCSRGERK